MTRLAKTLWLPAALSVGLMFIATSAFAGELPPPCDPKKEVCPPICHNIGGPRDLGANCEATGNCSVLLEDGTTLTLGPNQFLGIVISASEQALAAHIAHGDGPIVATFDPPLHLASEIGPHQASNVECLGTRVLPQPPEPGN